MNRHSLTMAHLLILFTLVVVGAQCARAADLPTIRTSAVKIQAPTAASAPVVAPTPPDVNSKAYLLVDADSGKVLAEHASTQRLQPASLTKIMTMYIVSDALRQGRVHLNDNVPISERAWRTGGSRMFVKVGETVPLEELIKGVIVQSGNDACVALAEHVAGSEESFAGLMNQTAAALGMKDSHFTDSTGMPDANHYTTARDMAILARALVKNFPEYYKWYSLKWFTHNGIRQPNRNRLLWRDSTVDGVKTGHTNEAGFCLVASANRDNMRLVATVLGAPTDEARASATESLLNFGFRFYESHRLYPAAKALEHPRVWSGSNKTVAVGLDDDLVVTIYRGQYKNLEALMEVKKRIDAPVKKGDVLGELQIKLGTEVLMTKPLVALEDNDKGSLWTRLKDSVSTTLSRWIGSSES